MVEASLDVLIAQSSIGVFDGMVQWLVNATVDDGYTVTIIFPVDEEMIVISHGADGVEESPGDLPGVRKRVFSPMLPTLRSAGLHGECVIDELRHLKCSRVGLSGMSIMSAMFVGQIMAGLDGITLTDTTGLVEELKSVKSKEEICFIRETCELQDRVFNEVLARVHLGSFSTEVRGDAMRSAVMLGADKTNIVVRVASRGTSTSSREPTRLRTGDHVFLLIETNGPGGYWGELGRMLTIGNPSAALEKQFGVALELQEQARAMLVPGAKPGHLLDANNELLRKHHLAEERRLYAHGMGYDMIERPSFDHFEKMRIRAGISIVLHPEANGPNVEAWLSDNYEVVETGSANRLHRTPQKIFAVQS